jgi:CHAT domain-containing protein
LLLHKAKAFSLLSNTLKDLRASLYNYQLYDSIRVRVRPSFYRGNIQFAHKVYNDAIHVCQRLYAQTQDKKYQRLAFYFAQHSHASFLAKSLQARRAKVMVHLPDSLISKEMYLSQQRAYYQQKVLKVKDSSQQKAYRDSVFSVVRAQDKLTEIYAQKFPKYFRLRYQSKPITLEQLQQKLSENAIVLSYVWGKEQSHVLAITHNDLNMYTLPPQAKITTALNAYHDALQQEQRLPSFAKKSYQAYQYLFAPVEKLLQGKQQVIVANPTLLSVPLEALVTQPYQPAWQSFGQLPYLIKKHSLSYHYSSTLWWQSQGSDVASITKKSLRFAAFAPFSGGKGKVMTTRANEGLLPESKAEVSTVYNFFKQKNYDAVAYLSKAATRREFLNQAVKSDILHIASHSTANLRETRLAKVHFAPQAQADSTYLYAESIYHLPLKARLVVLSSCESGVGKFVAGEGVESLARGFLHAGAQSVISSLWEADDAYTKKLMILFYNNALFHQDTYMHALSHAKRQLMHKEPQLHPKYWSCFILIGN